MNQNDLSYQNLQTILKRMRYDLSRTSTENSSLVKEQMGGVWAGTPAGAPVYPPPTTVEDKSKKYPNYCKYPEKTIPVEDDIAEAFAGYCLYARPEFNKNKSKLVGIWLPSDAVIRFTTKENINELSETLSKKYKLDKKILKENLSSILPVNSVMSFSNREIGSYQGIIQPEDSPMLVGSFWQFMGYKLGGLQGTHWYEEPKDVRTDYQKFIDNLSWWKQLAPFVVLSFLSLPASTLLWAELALSVALGGALAWREIEKGKDINAVFIMLLSLLPATGFFKSFRNVDPKVLKSLSDDIANATLNTADDVKLFYDDLAKTPMGAEKQKLFTKIATHDVISEEEILKSLQQLNDPKQLINFIKNTVKNNREQFMKLAFSDVVWKKQLKWAGALVLMNIGADYTLGRFFTPTEEELLQQTWVKLPEENRKEFVKFVTQQTQKALDNFKEMKKETFGKNFDSEVFAKFANDYGGFENPEYEELPENPEKAADEIEDTEENEKKYREMGYKQLHDFDSTESPSKETIFIGKRYFVKPVKNKNQVSSIKVDSSNISSGDTNKIRKKGF